VIFKALQVNCVVHLSTPPQPSPSGEGV